MPLTQTRWPYFVALVAGISAVALVWYFVLSNPSGEAVPASGGRYVEGVTRGPERINPLFAGANPTDGDLASLIFSGLVRLSPDGTPQPDLAERWEITGNGQSYTFHLRRGVAWQDGEPFTSEDVLFTYEAITDPGFKGDPMLAQLMQGVVVTARDPETVEFKLEQAYSPFLTYLTIGILPKHVLGSLDANQLFNASFNAHPVGTGPYAFVGRTDTRVALTRNPTYYLGPPKILAFEFHIFPTNDALVAAIREGSIEGVLLDPQAPDAELDFLREDRGFTLHGLVGTEFNIVYLDTRSPLFASADVRKALWQALDVPLLVTDVAAGRGVDAGVGIAKSSWAYSKVAAPEFDAVAAESSLEKAGWTRGSDGLRRKNGLQLAFTLSVPNDPPRVALANAIAEQWRAIDVDVSVQPLAASSFVADHLLQHKFEAALAAIDPGPDPDPYPFWHSTQIPPPGRNLSNYSDPQTDDALERARQTSDTPHRRELYANFAGFFVDAAPAIPLYAPQYTYVQSTRVQGYAESLLFTPASRFSNVSEWYVRTRVQ